MEETIAVTSAAVPLTTESAPSALSAASARTSQAPLRRGEPESPADHAAHYAEDRHWDVFPGTWLETPDGSALPGCSCGAADCQAPGAHPVDDRWAAEAVAGATAVRRLWATMPRASVLLPTGRTFDAVDVPETAGCLALARMERLTLPPGPVISTPDGRMLFFVLPGAAKKVPALVRGLGWSPGALDLATRGEGSWVAAPPTRVGTKGCVQWACSPTRANQWLRNVEEIVAPLAYAAGREAATARAS
ncbi:hypothetical protein N566_01965 [Streptomycetaceae bacterium MP113-05]|nr:hypothetical protein N566_01965 [Streptomycetaceae bacterium MP113-05]